MIVKRYSYIFILTLLSVEVIPLLAKHSLESAQALIIGDPIATVGFGEKPSVIISQIESGVLAGNVKGFSGYLSKQVFINLRGAESGYFSANQATYLLRSFFESCRIVRFKFTTVEETEEPYATGGGVMISGKGSRESFQVYIALSKTDNRWVISQFNVY
jgi:hypothetical protein